MLLCASTERTTLAVPKGIGQTKDAERRDKVSVRTGKESGDRQTPRAFQDAGDVAKNTAGL